MEKLERLNSTFDNEYDYYRKNLPEIKFSEENEESIKSYQKIFDLRNEFIILGLDSYIKISKNSLNKIASMINIFPQEYVLFTNHKIINEDYFEKISDKDKNAVVLIPGSINVTEEGFKKVDSLENNRINIEIFTKCLWLYLALAICSFLDLSFFLYISAGTKLGKSFYSIYTLILSIFLFFIGLYGFFKCRARDFSGYVLKLATFAVPWLVLGGSIIYLSSSDKVNWFWIKFIIDVISFIIGIVLILYIFGFIKPKKYNSYDENSSSITERLINTEKDSPVYTFES